MFGLTSAMTIGILRHLLTIMGGLAVSKGYLTSDLLDTIIGALLSLAGVGMSVVDKVQNPPQSGVQPRTLPEPSGGSQPSWVPPANN